MKFEEKRSFAIQELENTKLAKSNYNPPIFKFLHKVGLQVPFPHYNSFLSNVFFIGVSFGLPWSLFMYLFSWRTQSISVPVMAAKILWAAVFFGIFMAAYYKYGFRKYKLTSWDEIDAPKN